MNLFDIIKGAEFDPKEIDYTQYDLGTAISLCYYMNNAKSLTTINTALGEEAMKRLEVKNASLVSANPYDFNHLISLVNKFMNCGESKIGLTNDFISHIQG